MTLWNDALGPPTWRWLEGHAGVGDRPLEVASGATPAISVVWKGVVGVGRGVEGPGARAWAVGDSGFTFQALSPTRGGF